MSTTDPRVPATIRAMRGYIREHGWTQNSYRREDGSVCIFGAYNSVTGTSCWGAWDDGFLRARVARVLRTVIDSIEPGSPGSPFMLSALRVVEWNDTKGRTQDQVIHLLEMAEAHCVENPTNQEASG